MAADAGVRAVSLRQSRYWRAVPSDRLVSYGTFIVALATFALAFVAHSTNSKLERQLNVRMEADQRPWVGIDRVETGAIAVGHALLIRPIYKNTGRTPALNWIAAFDPPALEGSESAVSSRTECNPNACGRGVLVPDGEFPIEIGIGKERMTSEFVEAVKSQKQIIFILGRTDYRDPRSVLIRPSLVWLTTPTPRHSAIAHARIATTPTRAARVCRAVQQNSLAPEIRLGTNASILSAPVRKSVMIRL